MNPTLVKPEAHEHRDLLVDPAYDPDYLQADAATGKLPKEIQLMPAGTFRTFKGSWSMGPEQFDEAVRNFGRGVARVNGDAALPIDFNHNQSGPAAGWITGIINKGAEGLWATVEWSSAGIEALKGKVYRFCSIEFWFQDYEEPDDVGVFYKNVVEGAALTNIPLMRKMKPIMADKSTSGLTGQNKTHIVYLETRSNDVPVTLEAARAMKPAEVAANEEAKNLLVANKEKLNFAERVAFGLDADQKTPDQLKAEADAKKEADDVAAAAAAATAAGGKKLDAEKDATIKQLQAEAKERDERLAKLEADGIRKDMNVEVEKHVGRGAIKQADSEKWVNRLTASKEDDRKETLSLLESLPSNELLAGKKGDGSADGASDTQEELKAETLKVVEASKDKDGKPAMTYAQAQDEVLRANKSLAGKIEAERAGR